jgi:uncharacterized protein (DUF2141 family)
MLEIWYCVVPYIEARTARQRFRSFDQNRLFPSPRSRAMNAKILVAVTLYGLTLTAAGAADLVVTVTGVPDDRGHVVSGIFNSEKSFLKRTEAFASFRIKASKGDVGYSLKNVPPGKYAIGAFHDANDNDKLDADPSGQPTEVYGFSTDGHTSGPAGFADAAFEVGDQTKTVSIELGY